MVLCSFMQRQFSTQEQAFAQQVEKFLREFTGLPGAALWRTPTWREGLLERGWSAPDWPQRLGGPGWSAAQRYLWYRACYEILDDFCEPTGIAVVGPVLARLGSGVQQQRWLPDIAQLNAAWSLALTGAQELPVVKDGRLSGSYVRITQAEPADLLLCLASTSSINSAGLGLARHSRRSAGSA
ncbi:MAG: acyl-CoA dehydrogenase family protein [Pseudomonadota bacterium]